MKVIETRKNGSKRVYTKFTEDEILHQKVKMADQSFKEECDVNVILSRYMKTGQLIHVNTRTGVYADVSEIPDLMGAMTQVQHAQQAFDDLPAEIRKRFNNSPVEMINFLQDPRNDEEAIKLGLKVRIGGPNLEDLAATNAESGGSNKKTKSQKTKASNDDDDSNNDDK